MGREREDPNTTISRAYDTSKKKCYEAKSSTTKIIVSGPFLGMYPLN